MEEKENVVQIIKKVFCDRHLFATKMFLDMIRVVALVPDSIFLFLFSREQNSEIVTNNVIIIKLKVFISYRFLSEVIASPCILPVFCKDARLLKSFRTFFTLKVYNT